MNRNQFEARILDFLEGKLSSDERAEFERTLESDPAAQKSFQAYREVVNLEEIAAARKIPFQSEISSKVLERISGEAAPGRFGWSFRLVDWRLYMEKVLGHRVAIGGLAGALVLVLCLKIGVDTDPALMQIKRPIPEAIGGPVVPNPLDAGTQTTNSSSAPASSQSSVPAANALILSIPQGYRATTIDSEMTSGVEGYTRPGVKVDVVETKTENGQVTSRIISQDAMVLSAAPKSGAPGVPGKNIVTLLTSNGEALKIQSRDPSSKISLLLRGNNDTAASKSADLMPGRSDNSYQTKLKVDQDQDRQRVAEIFKKMTDRLADVQGQKSADSRAVGPAPRIESGSAIMTMGDGDAVNELAGKSRHQPAAGRIRISGKEYYISGDGKLSAAPSDESEAGRYNPWCCDYEPAPFFDSKSYNTYEENQRIQVSKEPMSTFSIDVDTASFSQTRRALNEGRLPHPDSIRIEELLNYFDYDYPVQSERPFTLSYEAAPSPLDTGKVLLKLGIKAKDSAPYEGGWNLVFLVDVSGSMDQEDKLPLVKKALQILVDRMKPADRVAIVTYAGSSYVALESTPATNKERIRAAIESLHAGGGTNGSGGILKAYAIAEQFKKKGAVNRVILATDGDFNVGVTSQADLIPMIEEKRRSGITLTTIGVGNDNLKDGMLEQLADKGNGNYFYLDSLKEARKVMGEDLTKNMEVVAKDVKLQIEFNPEHVKSYRLIGYDNRKLANKDFNNDAVDAGEIGAGHTVTALYELTLAGSADASGEDVQYRYKNTPAAEAKPEPVSQHGPELAFLKIRYKEPEGTESKLLQYPIESSKVQKSVEGASDDFRFAAAVSYFGSILRQSAFAGNYTLDDIAELARASRGKDERGIRQEFVEMVRNAAVLKREQGYSARQHWAE